MERRKLKRREFLQLSGATALGALVSACAAPTPEVREVEVTREVEVEKEVEVPVEVEKEVEVTVEVPAGRAEPPMLADRVAAGELPPVDERLPVAPAVVGGRDAIGAYGGEIRMIHMGAVWMTENYDLNSERMLHYSDLDLRTIVPNILESWEVSDDGKAYTIHLREGMKWSDGTPLTTEDVRFW